MLSHLKVHSMFLKHLFIYLFYRKIITISLLIHEIESRVGWEVKVPHCPSSHLIMVTSFRCRIFKTGEAEDKYSDRINGA